MFAIRITFGVVLAGLAWSPVQAADLGPAFDAAEPRGPAPYYVVNQGPEYSGPGITVRPLAWVNTDVRLSYPFIGTAGPVVPRRGYAPRYREPVLRRLAAAPPATQIAGIDRLATATITDDVDATGMVPRRRPGPAGVFDARAEVRMIGRDRIDIKLYREERQRAHRPQVHKPPRQAAHGRAVHRALRAQRLRDARRARRAYRAYRQRLIEEYQAGMAGAWSGQAPVGGYIQR